MYFSAKGYPEFSGKDKKYVQQCLTYCLGQCNFNRKIVTVILVLLTASICFGFGLDKYLFGISFSDHKLKLLTMVGVLFWLYFLYEINTTLYVTVKEHIDKFDSQYKE